MTIKTAGLFDWPTFSEAMGVIGHGAVLTFEFSALTMVLSLVLGGILAALRVSRRAGIRKVATAWVEVFRSTPLLVQMMWLFYVLPSLMNFELSGFITALLSLSLIHI